MTKRLIGTATTDDNGVATVTFTGVGGGLMNIVAEYNDGAIQSNTKEIGDYIVYDKAMGNDKNTNYETGTGLTVTSGDDYYTISAGRTYSTNGQYIQQTALTGDFEVTFQATSTTNVRIGVSNSNTQSGSLSIINYNISSSWKDIKFRRVNGVYSAYQKSINSDSWSEITINDNNAGTGTVYFLFYVYNSSTTVTQSINYRNLKIYHT